MERYVFKERLHEMVGRITAFKFFANNFSLNISASYSLYNYFY